MWFQKMSIPPWRVVGNSEREGVAIAKTYMGKNEVELEIPEDGGANEKKNPTWGRYGYFHTIMNHKPIFLQNHKLCKLV